MSNLQSLLYKLHVLAADLDSNAGDGSAAHETMPAEDTPEIAVARNLEISKLQHLLLALTAMCPLIQSQPENAMTRFLFSATLQKIGHDHDDLQDVLLPTREFYDESICRELKKTHLTVSQAHDICDKLCTQSIQSVQVLRQLKMNPRPHYDVYITPTTHSHSQVCWGSESLLISDLHLNALRTAYNTEATTDPTQTHFNRRLFCLLMRYKTVGGPMYQCSVTPQTFAVLQNQFQVTKECMASPFNHNADTYWSAFRDTDGPFGSQGSFFASLDSPLVTQGGSFYANPPFTEEILHLLTHHIQEILKFSVPVSFICLFPTWPDFESYNHMKNSPFCQKCVVLEPHKHAYIDGSQQINTETTKKHHVAQFKTTLFIVQNEMGTKSWPVNDHKIQSLLASFAVM